MTKTEAKAGTFPSKAFAAPSATSRLGPFTVQRRTPRAEDVQIGILYCGICHSDLHTVRNEWSAIMIAKEISSKKDAAP
jgi:alcohol dehydrogenase (NADP+)